MHETCLIIIHDSGIRPGPESNKSNPFFRTLKLRLHLEEHLRTLCMHEKLFTIEKIDSKKYKKNANTFDL